MITTSNNRLVLNKIGLINKFSLDEITINYLTGLTTQPTIEHVKLIDSFVKKIKTIITDKADVIYLGNINNSNDCYRNLVKNAHHGTKEETGLVWDDYWGYSNPDGTGYVNTHYNPATEAVHYSLNDAGISCYINGDNYDENYATPLACFETSEKRSFIVVGKQANWVSFQLNGYSDTGLEEQSPFYNGLFHAQRVNGVNISLYNQNILIERDTKSSTSIPNTNFELFRYGDIYPYKGIVNFVYVGSQLDNNEFTLLNSAVNEYLIQCLFLKYGSDNWGVKMAKSYFYELHNFEKYEAWEVYEFLKRHQPDYQEPIVLNGGSALTTDWVDSDSNGLADEWFNYSSRGICSIVTGNGFAGNAQRVEASIDNDTFIYQRLYCVSDTELIVRFKYRCNNGIGLWFGVEHDVPINTGDAIEYQVSLTSEYAAYLRFYVNRMGNPNIGDWFEISDIVIAFGDSLDNTGYLWGMFHTKTVCDYVMLFKAGGNLIGRNWSKGLPMRWNLDGEISNGTALPAYTRGSNLGIITTSSINGWDDVTFFYISQTSSSLNSFYGNMPNFARLKTGGSKARIYAYGNRMKVFLDGATLKDCFYGLYIYQTNTGGNRMNINYLVGGVYTSTIYLMGDRYATWGKLEGDITLFTNEFQVSTYIRFDKGITGSLENFIIADNMSYLYFDDLGLTGGLSTWNKNLVVVQLIRNFLSTDAINTQLSVINTYFETNTPIKNLTIGLDNVGMGIPTGGASNTDLLGIIAKFAAAGFTATITVNT